MNDGYHAIGSALNSTLHRLNVATQDVVNARTPGYQKHVLTTSSFVTELDRELGRDASLVRATHATAFELGLAELGGQHDLVAVAVRERTGENILVMAPAIHVRRIEKIDPLINRGPHEVDGLIVISGAVNPRKRHATQPNGGTFQIARAELAFGGSFQV